MDVSLHHWPIFATGLLLGAAGAMSLGLHRPTQEELASAVLAAAARPAAAPAATVAKVAPDPGAGRADEQMRAAAEAFRAQEALAAANAPFAVAFAQAPKPRVRRVVVKEADAEAIAAPDSIAPPIAIAPNTESEWIARPRSDTSVMGAAPQDGETRPPSE